MDTSSETLQTHKKYGIGKSQTDDFGRACLMARRFAESGVRFIELTHEGWDQHKALKSKLTSNCGATDQPIAALISDLKERDHAEGHTDRLEWRVWPDPRVRNQDGRDHNATGYSCGWPAAELKAA